MQRPPRPCGSSYLLTTAETCISTVTDKDKWSWRQLVNLEYAETDVEDAYLLKFISYSLKAPSKYSLEMGPHAGLEGSYKYGLFEIMNDAKLLAWQQPVEGANLGDLNQHWVANSRIQTFHCY